jgi:hypothetical protein
MFWLAAGTMIFVSAGLFAGRFFNPQVSLFTAGPVGRSLYWLLVQSAVFLVSPQVSLSPHRQSASLFIATLPVRRFLFFFFPLLRHLHSKN